MGLYRLGGRKSVLSHISCKEHKTSNTQRSCAR